jgi:hypothetical protein
MSGLVWERNRETRLDTDVAALMIPFRLLVSYQPSSFRPLPFLLEG